MEESLRDAVRQVLAAPDKDMWITRLDEDPDAVGAHVIDQLAPGVDKPQLSASALAQLSQGYLHLREVFSVDQDLSESPTDFLPLPKCPPIDAARLTVLAFTALLDHIPVSYGSENNGHLFVNLVAMPGDDRSAVKSTKDMRGHTDAVSFPFPGEVDPDNSRIAPSPDIVCLAGLRNPDEVPTMVIPLDNVLGRLEATDITQLEQLQFLIDCQATFREGTERILGNIHQARNVNLLLDKGEGMYWARFSHSKVTAAFESPSIATDAIKRFIAACEAVADPVVVGAGDVLLINNRRALHGRAQVGKEVGGNARWLLRSYGILPAHVPQDSYYPDSSFKLWP